MNKNFPCKKCSHGAVNHYVNVTGDTFICLMCAEGGRMDWIEPNEHIHQFVGDNLGYMELENKKEEIRNEH